MPTDKTGNGSRQEILATAIRKMVLKRRFWPGADAGPQQGRGADAFPTDKAQGSDRIRRFRNFLRQRFAFQKPRCQDLPVQKPFLAKIAVSEPALTGFDDPETFFAYGMHIQTALIPFEREICIFYPKKNAYFSVKKFLYRKFLAVEFLGRKFLAFGVSKRDIPD